MFYLVLLALMLSSMASPADVSESIAFKKSQKVLLPPAHAKWLKAETAASFKVEISGAKGEVTVKRPYSFFKGKINKGHLVFVIKNVKADLIELTPEQLAIIFGKDPEEDIQNFQVIRLIGQNGETDLAYCSCGGATVEQEGDGCFFYSDPPLIHCDGECSGDQSNHDCGVTMVDFTYGSPPKKVIME